jgi:3-oxoacyl-[acyl-carrier-protein] synthase-3
VALFTIPNIKIAGMSAAVPKNEVSNWDYDLLTEKEQKMLVKTTGVEKRRRAPEGMATSDLCFEAANRLLEELKWDRDEVQIAVFLSQSRDYILPATAIILQDRLGLSKNCMAFDIGLGCSGFVYGLSVIGSIMSTTGLKKGLLMMGDISSATCNYEDKSTYPLFGDAGTVTALEFDPSAETMHFNLMSDGSGHQAIMIPDGGIRNLITNESLEKKEVSEGIVRSDLDLVLNGVDVFNFSITQVHPSIYELLEKSNTTQEDYDYFLMHQANKLMNETIRKKMKFEKEKVPYTIHKYGNTSSASIPLTIVSELNEGVRNDKLSLLCSGFGVGLSWGTVTLTADHIVCPPVIEV